MSCTCRFLVALLECSHSFELNRPLIAKSLQAHRRHLGWTEVVSPLAPRPCLPSSIRGERDKKREITALVCARTCVCVCVCGWMLSCVRAVGQKEEAPLLPSFSEDEQAYQKRAWEGLIGVLLDSDAPATRHPPRARHTRYTLYTHATRTPRARPAHAPRTPRARPAHAPRTPVTPRTPRSPLPFTGASDAQDAPSRATWEPPSSTTASP
jgi:hypothetical protein